MEVVMKYLVFLFSVLISFDVFSDGFKTKEETRAFSDALMDHFVRAEFQEGLDSAKEYWPIPKVEIDGLANQIKQQWPIVDQRFGQPIEKEFISEKMIGQSFVRYYYLHKFENHSLYWQIDFYKPKELWKVNSLIYLDNLEPLFSTVK
jgi:hypothetical protein